MAELEPAADWAQSWGKNTAGSVESEESTELLASAALADKTLADKDLEQLEQEQENMGSLTDAVRFDRDLECQLQEPERLVD